jgi:membrane protein implicated in regulation of membrane protease activity
MLIVTGLLVLIALNVVPAYLGLVLVGAAVVFEVAEKGFWLWSSRRIPLAVGIETMLGRPVTAISPCRPDGRVRFGSESWMARCVTGAGVGESLIIEGIENLTLVVSNTRDR